MNFFFELFYRRYVEDLSFPLPIAFWLYWNEALATFPTIDVPLSGFTQSSRRTKKIQLIILHNTGSLEIAKALKWYSNPNTYSSTHYLIDLDGTTQQLVPEENASLHTPNAVYKHSRLVNESSIGISLVGDGAQQFTEAQYEMAAMLCVYLKEKYGLKNEEIFRHAEIECVPAVNDPTPWDKEKFNILLEQFDNI